MAYLVFSPTHILKSYEELLKTLFLSIETGIIEGGKICETCFFQWNVQGSLLPPLIKSKMFQSYRNTICINSLSEGETKEI